MSINLQNQLTTATATTIIQANSSATRLTGLRIPRRNLPSTNLGKPTNLLTAGLATTITAAALGSTGFRKNKLLDYIHMSKSSLDQSAPGIMSAGRRELRLSSTPNAEDTSFPETKYASNNSLQSNQPGGGQTFAPNSMLMDCEKAQTGPIGMATSPRKMAAATIMVSDSDLGSSDESESSSDALDDPSTAFKFQRRRSRAVLYHLSGRFDQKAKRKLPFKKFQRISGKEAIPEYKVQDVQTSKFILLHYSLFKIVWDWLILLCTFYIAIMVPYNAAFAQGSDGKDLIIIDIIVELLFIIDIALNFATTYVSKSGQVVYQLKNIAINYIRGWFFLDLLAAIPFDVILAVNNPEIQDTIGGMGNWIYLLKLARLLRLARLFQKIERYSQYSTVILGLLMCMFFLVAHWFACGWYCIGKEEFRTQLTREYSWLYELGERMHVNSSSNQTIGLSRRALYVSSLYFTTTSLTSVGFGNVSPNTVNEKIFAITTMLIGALMHAAVFGNVTTLIQRMYARRSAYQTKNQDLKDFTRAHHIPKALKQRMLEFFQAMWAINRGIDKDAIMQSFPDNLRGDIALHLNREILSLSLFKTASPGCCKCLAQLITTRFATPGEYLVNQGDVLKHIYFVCSGSLEILGDEGTVVGLLGKCDIFGSDIDAENEFGFSAYNVKSLTYCELQCIALDKNLQEIFDQYPQFRKDFAAALQDELSFNLRAGFDPNSSMEVIPAITIHNKKSSLDIQSENTSLGSFEFGYPNRTILPSDNLPNLVEPNHLSDQTLLAPKACIAEVRDLELMVEDEASNVKQSDELIHNLKKSPDSIQPVSEPSDLSMQPVKEEEDEQDEEEEEKDELNEAQVKLTLTNSPPAGRKLKYLTDSDLKRTRWKHSRAHSCTEFSQDDDLEHDTRFKFQESFNNHFRSMEQPLFDCDTESHPCNPALERSISSPDNQHYLQTRKEVHYLRLELAKLTMKFDRMHEDFLFFLKQWHSTNSDKSRRKPNSHLSSTSSWNHLIDSSSIDSDRTVQPSRRTLSMSTTPTTSHKHNFVSDSRVVTFQLPAEHVSEPKLNPSSSSVERFPKLSQTYSIENPKSGVLKRSERHSSSTSEADSANLSQPDVQVTKKVAFAPLSSTTIV